jgi:tRNA-specific 2-thiouridylase
MDLSIYKNKKVLVAMSGGVDSSMVAVMFKKAGAMPIGVTFKLGDTKINLGSSLDSSCCTIDDINDARDVAVRYDFPHMVFDLKAEFEKNVIDDFANRTIDGFTPNPCIMCNKTVKWGSMLKYAEMLNCDYVATGHYARIKYAEGRYFLSRPLDLTKDQTYFLSGLGQSDLAKTIFPLGDYLKSDIKEMAINEGFTVFAEKSESFDICFVGDATYKDFMLAKYPHLINLNGGDIVTLSGDVIGKHSGYLFYTIGQRKALGISLGKPTYVIDIDVVNNRLIVGDKDDLKTNVTHISEVNFMKFPSLVENHEFMIKVRSMDKGTIGSLSNTGDDIKVTFFTDVKGGVCRGQTVVVYDGDDVVCSGFILANK